MDTPLTIASHSERQKKWYDRTVTISSKNLKKTGDIPAEGTPADGIYSTSAVTGAAMFKVVGTKLTVKNGKMTALITLSGIGYDYLYMGTEQMQQIIQTSGSNIKERLLIHWWEKQKQEERMRFR